ncbi:WecB/TagA/CpsF family glycosyltransferase [Acidocella aquatica]|uniref:WecB/TagA/CpsF family glycosyltransferase n=1 Tax=Acidocella aquatica TaxID=1922313 RepID=UPI0024E0A469|nr:WecB/TagA/CpsF family glycosyltransferase [Acidocella aquatica]
MSSITLLGLTFDDAPLAQVTAGLLARVPGAPFAYVVTPNADHLVRLRRSPGLLPLYQAAQLRLLDSRFIALAARALGLQHPAVVPGADLAAALLEQLRGARIAVIGMQPPGFAALAARYPANHFMHHAPPGGLLNNPAAFARAREFGCGAQADFTFIALGSPLQEHLAHAIATQGGATGTGLCIGSALDFCAGVLPRAPLWMRRNGLEWLYRLRQEPRRLARRYLRAGPAILRDLLSAAWARKGRRS